MNPFCGTCFDLGDERSKDDIMIRGNMVATWKMSYDGMCEGTRMLTTGGKTIHEAIIHAVKCVEDNPEYVSVGYGGLPNIEGEVELDAAYMNGDTLGIGGVISVQNIKNPIEVAYDLSRYKRNCLLAGTGAMRYAHRRGFEFRNMLTKKAEMRYQDEKTSEVDMEVLEAYGGHDTVCIMGKDPITQTIACGVSTSGLFLKRPGRVGDSPVTGAGFYADSEVGSAAATGVGEDIMKGCLSFAIVERLRMGIDVQTACELVLSEHIARLNRRGHKVGSISVIAMAKDNQIGAATNKKAFPFVVGEMDGSCSLYAAVNEGPQMEIICPDAAWTEAYKGD